MSTEARGGERAIVAVYGCTGMAGAALCRALVAAGAHVRLVGRHRGRVEALAATLPGAEVALAAVDDRAALLAAFVGSRVVVNAAGPFAELGEGVVTSAIACGSHYLDLCAEPAALRRVIETCDAAARRAQVAVVPGAAFAVAMGDLLTASAAARLLGHHDDGPTVRHTAGRRLVGAHPISVAVGYLFDDLALPPGAQASLFANLHAPTLVWRRDRWDEERPGRRQRSFNPGPPPAPHEATLTGEDHAAGAVPSSEREAFSIGGGDALTIPRHLAAISVETYLSLSRRPGIHRALRLAAMAASWLPPQASALLVPSESSASAYAATRFAVMASVHHGFDQRHAVAHGRDLYATSTAITARLALGLALRPAGPFGVLAPAEIVRASQFLDELVASGVLQLLQRSG
jgi:Saccharopine dehydrogenase NADP binding domain